jgi:group I intron endonuclease
MIGIYRITNPSGKNYIGQSNNIERRWKSYYSLNCKGQPKLYASLSKYGINKHKFEILEQCKEEELYKKEYYYIQQHNSFKEGLNACEGFDIMKLITGEIKMLKEKPYVISFLAHVLQEMFTYDKELYNDITECMQSNVELKFKLIQWHFKKEKEEELKDLQTRREERLKRFMNKYSKGIHFELRNPYLQSTTLTQESFLI